MTTCRLFAVCVSTLLVFIFSLPAHAQFETATVSGRITDSQGKVAPGVQVQIVNNNTGFAVSTETNGDGLYVIPGLRPGQYRLIVRKDGFREIVKTDLVLQVQDVTEQNFSLQVGSVSESVTVTGGAQQIDTQTATVSTVIDRQFVENLPLNGRSFQTLIALTPGVVLTPATFSDSGQFSVNGQRSSSNYFTVDGVSANIGIGPFGGLSQTAGGSIAGFSATGGTNSLVSEDALQEFRIQTSTFAPEFGRTPGAQVSIVTRSGTNQFHGAAFEYLRNDKLDANDWFSNQKGLRKSQERINDFGGVLGGPIVKDRTFFFFSYEGQRLRLPQTAITTVPSVADRQAASPAVQPILNAYPLPNIGVDGFAAGYSNSASLNATSVRIDHTVNSRLTVFGRYNNAPSDSLQRGGGTSVSLSSLLPTSMKNQMITLGAMWSISPLMNNDFRFNYSRTRAASSTSVDTFGGAVVPPDSIFPAGLSSQNAHIEFDIFSLQNDIWGVGRVADNLQRQLNFLDSISIQKGSHSLKFGGDYRRLSPFFNPDVYLQYIGFSDVPSVLAGAPLIAAVLANRTGTVLFRNLGLFAQDTWKATPRLAITYGVRWDVDFTPKATSGPNLVAVTGFNDLNSLALAPDGTPIFKTRYNNFTPRVGVAYQLRTAPGRETVLRGGFGIYNDLATSEVGDAIFGPFYPYGALSLNFFTTYPLPPSVIAPPPFDCTPSGCEFVAFDPNLQLPRTFQWNVTLEQSLGDKQVVSVAYVAAAGRRLLQQEVVNAPNPNFVFVGLVRNAASSDYDSMQLQYRRRLSKGVQALASYTWSHSIDNASSSSMGSDSNSFGEFGPSANRGPSDFDIRHSFSAALMYAIPGPVAKNRVVRAVLRDWALDNVIQARSGAPVNVSDSSLDARLLKVAAVRPDLVPGMPLYLTDPSVAGGRRINPGAFTPPPLDPDTGVPLRQGTLGRNALRGFGAAQWDFAVRREFTLHETLRLQFKTEFFNLLNHPNFANPISNLSSPLFGQSITMLSRGLGSDVGSSGGFGFASVFQVGGPRSIQFGLKLQF